MSGATAVAHATFPEQCEAKCGVCGTHWIFSRHDGLGCPYCNCIFETVEFNIGKRMAWFEGITWKALIKQQRAAREKLAEQRAGS